MTTKRFNRVGGYVYDGDKCISHFEDVSHRDDIVKILNELHEENKQLKEAIAETEKIVQSTYDELTKLRCFKKNILQIKHSWDFLMEAIQYD